MPGFSNLSLNHGEFHDYVLGEEGNLWTNAFVAGEIGAVEDFFIVASEPQPDSNYPMITGNFFDSEGHPLFRIVRNVLSVNPGNCTKILGNRLGYEIHDSADEFIFAIDTRWSEEHGKLETSIRGKFFDRNGTLVMEAFSGAHAGGVWFGTKYGIGFNETLAFASTMTADDVDFAATVLSSHGAIHQPIRGNLGVREIDLEGIALIDVTAIGCTFRIRSSNFRIDGKCHFERCKWEITDEAAQIVAVINLMNQGTTIRMSDVGHETK